jgi:cobalamin-dependent methionine synthase I
MIIIGEKINGTRKRVENAIVERNSDFIKDLALKQVKAGTHYLNINAGTAPEKEPEDLVWLINTVLEVTDVTLCLDSVNSTALFAGIKAEKKMPMLNSLSGEKKRVDQVLPLACEYQAELIVLALDDKGIPKTVEERLNIVRRLVEMTRKGNLPDNKLYIDPTITAVSTNTESGNIAFNTIRRIREEFPEVCIKELKYDINIQ